MKPNKTLYVTLPLVALISLLTYVALSETWALYALQALGVAIVIVWQLEVLNK